MTLGVLGVPPVPRKAPGGRAATGARALAAALAVAALAVVLSGHAHAKRDGLPDGVISEVKIEGNVSIPSDQIRAKILSKPGQPLDQRKIEADLKSLLGTKWFSSVQPYYEESPPGSNKYILTFAVKEMPVLTHVEFRGRTKNALGVYKVSLKDIEQSTGLKKGNRADATRTQLAVQQIQRLYAEKGYDMAEVRLVEGGNRGDTRVVIQIYEGPKHVVRGVDFEGNVFATDDQLKTKISSKPSLLRLNLVGGTFHRDSLEDDARKLREYYQGQGFYEVKVNPVTRTGATPGDVYITFVVSEGVRYRVRNILFEGNRKLTEAKLREGLKMHSGQPILDALKEADRKNLITKYYEIGCIDTQIIPDPRITNEPGVVDVLYKIEEGEPYFMGELIIKGNDRTQDRVLRREANMAGFLPGEVLNPNRMEIFKKRLGATGFFTNAPDQGKGIDIKIVNRRPGNKPYGDVAVSDIQLPAKLQSPESEAPAPAADPWYERFKAELARKRRASPGGIAAGPRPNTPAYGDLILGDARGVTRLQDPGPEVPAQLTAPAPAPGAAPAPGGLPGFGAGEEFSPPPDTVPSVPAITVPTPPPGAAPPVAGPTGPPPTTTPLSVGEPPGMFPSIPGMNANDVGPDRQDPFRNRAYADVMTSIEEAPTGRFMAGIGASGSQGLTGSVQIIERNFNIFNFPRSWTEVVNGQAFRGGGQEFQVQAMVGTLINRFTISLRDPYLFDLPIGGGATGYVFNRLYPDWSEDRGGGRFWLGRQFGVATYADVAFRAEAVNFYGYKTPAPADFLAATGTTDLFSIRPSLRFDNRNAPFLPNKGQYLEFSFEQGWGTFTFPKFEVEGRTYFTLGSRPDGTGPRTLELRGHFGVTGPNTPVYERFFAGYFGSLRGFNYRGVGPHVLGVNVGGLMEAIGSVEYMFPLTASDSVRQVVFCDFGTVTPGYEFVNPRVSVGTGLRVTIPAMGPLPLAFDLGFPVVKAPGDRVQIFNFSVGANY